MYASLVVCFIYFTFVIDFLIIPLPSEGSTKSLVNNVNRSGVQRFLLVLVFVIHLAVYLFPLFISALQLFAGLIFFQVTWIGYIGMLLACLGRVLSVSGSVILTKRLEKMTTHSVFRWSRNPIALGMHITLLGLIIVTQQWFLVLGLFFSSWNIDQKIKIEELHLERKFGLAYTKYKQQTPRYLWM